MGEQSLGRRGASRGRSTSRGSKASRGSKPPPPALTVAQIVDRLNAEMMRKSAVPKTLVAELAAKDQRLAVFDALVSEGIEVGSRFLRWPLGEQIEMCVEEEPRPLAGLETFVAGASSREVNVAVRDLVERGRVRLLVRDRKCFVAHHRTPVVDARTRERLATLVEQLRGALRIAKRSRASIARADIEAMLRPFVEVSTPPTANVPANGTKAAPRPPSSAPRPPSSAPRPASSAPRPASSVPRPDSSPPARIPAHPPTADVASLIDANREATGLTSVPKLVRLLGGSDARAVVHAELLRGARAGLFELRPESGHKLSAEDAALCLPGPQGSRLSWVRRVDRNAEEPS